MSTNYLDDWNEKDNNDRMLDGEDVAEGNSEDKSISNKSCADSDVADEFEYQYDPDYISSLSRMGSPLAHMKLDPSRSVQVMSKSQKRARFGDDEDDNLQRG